jgi:transcriptional adapter 2-alpha
MNVFARFHSKEEHDDLIDGLIAEHRLRGRIQQLQNYRMLGIRTLAEGDLYEIEKRRKESQEKSQNTSPRRKLPQAATPITSSKSRVRSSTSRTPVSENPNMSALKDAERQLCEELDITPLQFAALKSSVIDESIARGLLNPTRKETGFLRVEINKTKRLFDFFISEHEYPITSDAMDSSNS